MSARFKTKTFVMTGGERYCLLLDRATGVPVYYPNLFMVTQVRNRSLSLSAMETALRGITVLLELMEDRGQDLVARFRARRFLELHELDALRDHCQRRFRPLPASQRARVAPIRPDPVGTETEYTRLSTIAAYVGWLATLLLGQGDRYTKDQIQRMVRGLTARRPQRTNRSSDPEKGLSETQLNLVLKLFHPESARSPFADPAIRRRNFLMFQMLYHLGIRGGELLNIRIRDIDFATNQVVIARRPDEPDDPRTVQPLVKTQDRRLPLGETLAKRIHDYVLNDRRRIPNARGHDYLVVTHKPGPTQGQPLSISSYQKIFGIIQERAPSLVGLTGHVLRHDWNHRFSNFLDAMDHAPSPENQEKLRSYLMGWKEGSGTAAIYNKRFVRRKAQEAALQLQESGRRTGSRPTNDRKSK